jgi:hypothetical protein
VAESNIAVLAIGAALASGAILLGDPPQPTSAPVAAVSAAIPSASSPAASERRRLAEAALDCVTRPDTPGCRGQIVANVASDPQSLSHPEEALHAPVHGCIAAADASLQGDCSAGDAVAL